MTRTDRKTPLRLLLAGTVAAFALTATPAAANMFDDWDADGSGDISSEEFSTGLGETGAYESWDTDDDGLLDDGEIGDVGLDDEDWDLNDDGLLDEEEFGEGTYKAYDANNDDALDEEEWSAFEDDADEQGWFDV